MRKRELKAKYADIYEKWVWAEGKVGGWQKKCFALEEQVKKERREKEEWMQKYAELLVALEAGKK